MISPKKFLAQRPSNLRSEKRGTFLFEPVWMNMGFNQLLETLLSEEVRDPRYSPSVEEAWFQGKQDVDRFLRGEVPAAEASSKNYRVVILPNGREIYIRLTDPEHPVPSGLWMGFWDPDLQEVVGLSKEEYDALSQKQKMEADATVQVKKYVPNEFWEKYASTYYPQEYDTWWWDEGGAKMAHSPDLGGWAAVEAYWRKRFA